MSSARASERARCQPEAIHHVLHRDHARALRRTAIVFAQSQTQQRPSHLHATGESQIFVRCNAETNPPEVRELGQVVTEIGVAIVKPAEFVIFRIEQLTGG